MAKVITLDAAKGTFRVYFPAADKGLLAAVKALPVRRFVKDEVLSYWTAGADGASTRALSRLAFERDFVLSDEAADRLLAACTASDDENITCTVAAKVLSTIQVKTAYDAEVVGLLRGTSGAVYNGEGAWFMPVHDGAVRTVVYLLDHCGLTIAPVAANAIQVWAKTQAMDGYASVCATIDRHLEPVHASRQDSILPLARVPVTVAERLLAGAAANKTSPRLERTKRYMLERAEDRGFAAEGALMTVAQIAAVLANLKTLASVCDGAAQVDFAGFNGPDSKPGRRLAELNELAPAVAAYARSFLRKYTRQLGHAVEAMY